MNAQSERPTAMGQAEFARHRGVSKAVVTKWKGQGLLVLTEDGKVDVERTEWSLDQRPASYRGGTTHRPVRAIPRDEEPVGKPIRPAPPPRPAALAPQPVNDEARGDPVEIDWDDPNLPPNLAMQRKENYLGLLRKLDHAVKQGILVERPAAEAAFFEEARTIRDALIAWPARVSIEMAEEIRIDPATGKADARELTPARFWRCCRRTTRPRTSRRIGSRR